MSTRLTVCTAPPLPITCWESTLSAGARGEARLGIPAPHRLHRFQGATGQEACSGGSGRHDLASQLHTASIVSKEQQDKKHAAVALGGTTWHPSSTPPPSFPRSNRTRSMQRWLWGAQLPWPRLVWRVYWAAGKGDCSFTAFVIKANT